MNNASAAAAAAMGMVNMPNGIMPQPKADGERERETEDRLNAYIYEYLLKRKLWESARAFWKSGLNVPTGQDPNKLSGLDESSMDMDSKDNIDGRPSDLPAAFSAKDAAPEEPPFLLQWFATFWDIWAAQRGKLSSQNAQAFAEHSRLRAQQMNSIRQQGGMQGMNRMLAGVPGANGMLAGVDLRQRAMANSNNRNMTPVQQMNLQRSQQMMLQQMDRAGSESDMNGRPRTPSSGDNAPSPSKRQRVDGPQMPQQLMAANAPIPPQLLNQHMRPGQNPHQMMINNGIPGNLSAEQFSAFQNQPNNVQRRSVQAYQQNILNQQSRQANATSPNMMGMDGGPGAGMGEFYANGNNAAMRMGMMANQGGAGGNHALQDYQMQLMLLEQQNKKRLLMARQEQDNNIRPDGQQGGVAAQQPGSYAPGMSPSGSRSGPSPNPSDQMKRGTPKMGSPMPDGMGPNRGSPAPGTEALMSNGAMVRPQTSHPFPNGMPPSQQQQIEHMRLQAQQGGRMPNGANWVQGPQGQAPMQPQLPQQAQQQMGTPRPHNAAMPPPSGVPNNNAANGRPASPAPAAAPPTPSQGNKANPKGGKKENKDRAKRPTKKNSTAAAPTPQNETDNLAATPTPQTPVTAMNPKSFNEQNKNNQATNSQQTNQSNAAAAVPAAPQNTSNEMMNLDLNVGDNFNMDFGNLDHADVLEQFDFDAFIDHTMSETFDQDNTFGLGDLNGVEAGTNDM